MLKIWKNNMQNIFKLPYFLTTDYLVNLKQFCLLKVL